MTHTLIGDVPVYLTDRMRVLRDIYFERDKQDGKWGIQDHVDVIWQTILIEEVGEAAQEVLTRKFGDSAKGHGNLRVELVQVAAVAVAWIECIDRNDK